MVATEDLFTPIHKAIRSMIYNLGGRLQSNDFGDLTASEALIADLEHEFSSAMSAGCILCLLHSHASDEETGVFPEVSRFDPGLVLEFIEDHHELSRRLAVITKMSRDLVTRESAEERVRFGAELTREANDFFADYQEHMNREERKIVPMMRMRFTDEQMRTMRGAIMRGMPPERLASILRWMLPSLNLVELTSMMVGSKASMPPEQFRAIADIAAKHVPTERWQVIQQRLGA